MFCGKCGNKLKGTEKFCTKCGNKIPEKQKVNEDVKQTEKPVMIDSNIEDNIVENKTNADILEKNEKIDAKVSKEETENNQEEIIESEKKEEIIEPKEEIEKKENPEVKEETQVEKPELVNQSQKIETSISKERPLSIPTQNSTPTTTNKKVFLIVGGILLGLILLVIILVICLIPKVKINWNENYSDYKLEYVSPTNIVLGVDISDKDKVNEIKYEVTCGETKSNLAEVTWNLKECKGTQKITASYKRKKVTKEYKVINNYIEKNLTLDYKVDQNSDEDIDFDGLTNKEEKKYKTNPELADTDMDGLDDKYEIETSKTDPNKKDTDGDGLSDYDEIELKLDPLKQDSKGDGTKDGNRKLTYEYNQNNLKVTITGKGNIASTLAEVNSGTKISNKKGLINKLYTFHTEGKISEATVTIPYTDSDLSQYGLKEENLTIYYYNEKTSKYEKVNTTIDKDNNTLTATLKHFSNYVVGDSKLTKESTSTQVLFILDNSWSMYTNEQYKKYTGKEYTGGLFDTSDLDGFDAEGVRFTLTSNLVNKLSKKNFQLGLSEFRRDYKNALKIGSDAKSITSKLSTMMGNFITTSEGTNITNALTNGINEFTSESDYRYIILLTDGQDSSLKNNTQKIIDKANNNDVKICSIGFGGGSYNIELSNISNGTGCKFYSSGNVTGLSELFANVGSELNDDLVDIDGDGNSDGILVADSGFLVNRDGFSFGNYGSNLSPGGHCYGMATFAELYYKQRLPLTLPSKVVGEDTSYSYDLTNTYFKNYSSLYDYKLKTNELKHIFGYEYFEEEMPSDYMTLNKDKLVYNENYKKEILNSKIYDIKEVKTGLTKAQQLEKWGVNYKTADDIVLNEDLMQKSSKLQKDDKQLFNAIYASFIKQNTDRKYSSGSDFVTWARNAIGKEIIDYSGEAGFINVLKTRLQAQDAPTISSSFSGGLHAVNAISLVQDIENPNHYYIGVYDNNYPGEKRYVDLECKKGKCYTVKNNYYTSSKQPIRLTPSLEEDLSYYQ